VNSAFLTFFSELFFKTITTAITVNMAIVRICIVGNSGAVGVELGLWVELGLGENFFK
jgi:hypothetical protein